MCSEGLVFRKQQANRPTVFDFSPNPLDTGKYEAVDTIFSGADTDFSGLDTGKSGAESELSEDTNSAVRKSRKTYTT